MKVFTVGLDEKEKAKAADVDKMESGSAAPVPTPATAVPVVRVPKPSVNYCKGWFSMVVCLFFVIILALTISEISYNRQRDEQFLRLKWAELKQRMLGMELLRQSQAVQQAAQTQQAAEAQKDRMINVQPPAVIDERLAFSKRIGQDDTPAEHPIDATTVKPIVPENSKENVIAENNDSQESTGDLRLDFLRAILGRIREQAAQSGIPTDNMKVSVIAIKKPAFVDDEEPRASFEQSLADGFGEWHAPRPFGPNQREQDYSDYDSQSEPAVFNRNFDRDGFRGQDRFPARQFNQDSSEMRPWGREFNPIFNDDMDVNNNNNNQHTVEEKPRMKITHHFEKENAMPARIVTELYGDNAETVLKSLLAGQMDAASQQQQQQQQQQGVQIPQLMPPVPPQPNQQAPLPMNVQFPLPEQPWLRQNDWHNMPVPQGPMMGPFMPPQQQNQQQTPQQFAAQFGAAFGQTFSQNWDNAQREQQQNNWQNQLPQSFTVDRQQPLPVQQQPQQPFEERPWYQADAWNTQEQKLPAAETFKPAVPIVSNTGELSPNSEEDQPRFTDINESEENEGIDNFERKEQFNVPIDMMSDEKPETVPASKEFKPNQWMHSQPKEAEESPVAETVDSSASFLPLRDDFKDEPAPKEESPFPEDANHDDGDFRHNPLFQIDDPTSIKH